jgi:hypothetical protein
MVWRQLSVYAKTGETALVRRRDKGGESSCSVFSQAALVGSDTLVQAQLNGIDRKGVPD